MFFLVHNDTVYLKFSFFYYYEYSSVLFVGLVLTFFTLIDVSDDYLLREDIHEHV